MNGPAIGAVRQAIGWVWWRVLRHRSQGNNLAWRRTQRHIARWLPPARICHPYPLERLGIIAKAGAIRGRTPAPSVAIHTGFWGCGAYGGNRVLMAVLQLLAARLSRVDRLVFHTVDKTGTEAFTSALRVLERELSPGDRRPEVTSLLKAIHALAFEWGVSDGT